MEVKMEITLNKTELASALMALGKLVSRTATVEANRAIEIRGFANHLHFRSRNIFEEIEFTMFAEMEEDFPTTLVFFEQFRSAIRNCKNKTLKFECDCGEIYIENVSMAPVKGHFPLKERIPDHDVCVTELPADTLSALETIAPIAAKGILARRILTGINISRDGFTAANDKELSNIPVSLEMTGNVTIPFPLVLLATKAFGESGKLTTWQMEEETHFELALGNWAWRTKAISGNYPNWKQIVPERTGATHFVSFHEESAEQLRRYLKSIPDDPNYFNSVKLSRLPEAPDSLHLESSNGILLNIPAECDANWGDLDVKVRKEYLLHLLNAGHRKIELNDALSPVVGTGGIGQYITMPIRTKRPQVQNEQKPEDIVAVQTDIKSAVQPEQDAPQPGSDATESVSVQNLPHPQENAPKTTIINTTSNKENPIMNENTTIRTVSATQTSPTNIEANPLDELAANIEAFKAKLKALSDESVAMARKIREVAITQRQKERAYQHTKRTLERVRVATAC